MKVKRDCMIVLLLVLALVLTACAGKGKSEPINWTQLASDAAPSFGKDECGQTLTWNREIGRWEAAGKTVVVDGQVVIRIDCEGADDAAPATP